MSIPNRIKNNGVPNYLQPTLPNGFDLANKLNAVPFGDFREGPTGVYNTVDPNNTLGDMRPETSYPPGITLPKQASETAKTVIANLQENAGILPVWHLSPTAERRMPKDRANQISEKYSLRYTDILQKLQTWMTQFIQVNPPIEVQGMNKQPKNGPSGVPFFGNVQFTRFNFRRVTNGA